MYQLNRTHYERLIYATGGNRMAFDKSFFETLGQRRQDYMKIYPCGVVTVTIKIDGQEYNVVRILNCDGQLLTFVYYSDQKSRALSEKLQEKSGEPTAWPTLTIPYSAIFSVEFNPGEAEKQNIGFQGN